MIHFSIDYDEAKALAKSFARKHGMDIDGNGSLNDGVIWLYSSKNDCHEVVKAVGVIRDVID